MSTQKGSICYLLIPGLIIALVGFGFHFAVPGVGQSGLGLTVNPDAYSVTHLSSNTSGPYTFGLDIMGPETTPPPNCSVYLLSPSAYEQFAGGSNPSSLDALLALSNTGRSRYESQLESRLDVYLVIFNPSNQTQSWSYYYSLLPISFYPSFIIGFSGIFIIVANLIWMTKGWKRKFLIGLFVNLSLFFMRAFTLSSYSLGVPAALDSLELYNDYQFFYLSWVPSLWAGGYPYGSTMLNYIYSPYWIYIVSIFGSVPPWLPAVPLFASSMATGIVVHKIVLRLTGDERKSSFAMLLYLLNPIVLLYGSFVWLNPTIYTFFCSLSFLFALEDKDRYAIVTLGIATLIKQFSVILFPLLSIYLIKKHQASITSGLRNFLEHTLVYMLVVGLGSLPFLLIDAQGFINRVLIMDTGSIDLLSVFNPALYMPVNFNTFFLWLGLPAWFTNLIAWLLAFYVFLGISGVIVYGGYALFIPRADSIANSQGANRQLFTQAILWSIIALLCVQTFFPRGAYKFYLLALIPFASILYDFRDLHFSSMEPFQFKPHLLASIIMSLAIVLCYRFVYIWLIVGWAWFYLWKSGTLSGGSSGADSSSSGWQLKGSAEIDEIATGTQSFYPE
jgi:hypothetical protein